MVKVLADKAEMESAAAEANEDVAVAEATDADAGLLTHPQQEEVAEGEDAMELDAEEDLEEADAKEHASAEESSEADSDEFAEADVAESTEASPSDVVQGSEVEQPELSTEKGAELTEEAETQDLMDVDDQVAPDAGTGAKTAEVETHESGALNAKGSMETDGEAKAVDSPAGKADESPQVFVSGDAVEIFGLQTDAGKVLNGQRGKVLEVHDGDRLEVRCKPANSFLPKIVNLKACNLQKVKAT